MPPIRVGILGAARIAPPALIKPALDNPEFQLICVAARDESRAEEFARLHGIASVAPDYAALIARDDIDLVYNPLPISGHKEWTIRALRAGKHVLCEKPFAMNARQAREMVAAADETGRSLIEAFHYRYHAVLKRAFAIAASGELGTLTKAEAIFTVPIKYSDSEIRWLPQHGGGALMDLGCYPVHALRSAMACEPTIVSAHCEVQHGVDAVTSAELVFPNGVSAKLHCSMIDSGFAATLRVTGTKGNLEILNFVAPQMGCRFTVEVDGVKRSEPTDGLTTYAAQLAHVGDVLLRGAKPLTGGADAIANMACIDAIYAAAGFSPFASVA